MSQIGGVSVVLALESVSDITVFISYLIGIACVCDTNTPLLPCRLVIVLISVPVNPIIMLNITDKLV